MKSLRQRSLLFVPGNKPDMIAKTPRSSPDVVIIDLEDSIPVHQKSDARTSTFLASKVLASDNPQISVMVRVNSAPSSDIEADISEALSPQIAGVLVPKVESPEHVRMVRSLLAKNSMADMRILCGIESAAGVIRCDYILDSDMLGAYFGSEDYIADVGGVRTESNTEVLFARSRLALACRLVGIPAIDQIVTNIDDSERFRIDAAQGRAIGYKGKMCIHPAQVPVANAAFTPSGAEVDRARRLLDAYQEGITKGSAAIRFEGEMIDEPLARQARLVVLSAAEATD